MIMENKSKLDQLGVTFSAEKTGLPSRDVQNVLNLVVNEGCTVPFIARYRKEVTGNMDETNIRLAIESYEEYGEREKRRSYILETIDKMEALTPELKKSILGATTIQELEDIYAPYKSKKKTKAMMAKDKGLTPLSEVIIKGEKTLDEIINSKEYFPEGISVEEGMEGAKDIIQESIAHHLPTKEILRELYLKDALVISEKRSKAKEVPDYHKFQDFFDYKEKLSALKDPKNGHRFLALRRGMSLKVLKVDVAFDEDIALGVVEEQNFPKGEKLKTYTFLKDIAKRAYKVAIHSSLDLEFKTELKNLSDTEAINVFSVNLKNLLLSPYLGSKAIMGVDPGVRTGCKVALIDDAGKFLADFVIYPHEPQRRREEAKTLIEKALSGFKIEYIAIGNGTYGRETLQFFEDEISYVKEGKVKAILTSESGASVYSASEIAKKEFPDKDVTVRGAISIARRVQDPLAELVKIDPKSIGVGQYQHDVNQTKLKKSLKDVVESCVNYVGVDLNTASAPLLSYVSGIGPKVAENIVSHREKKGVFKKRYELLKVTRFSDKVYQQAAGFLRIYQGENPLDSTFVHPERYGILEKWCQEHQISLKEIREVETINKIKTDTKLRSELGELTFNDIVTSISAKVQDPRTIFKSTEFSKKLREFKDIIVGEWYQGAVTNITKFGVFIDIGIKENGLAHISELADHFVEDPLTVVKVGQEVIVRVIGVDKERKRISLSLKKGALSQKSIEGQQRSSGHQNSGKRSNRRDQQRNNFSGNKAFSNLRIKI